MTNTTRYRNTESTAQTLSTPRSNRFRKIVESAVQANRQVVESAQRDDDGAGAEQRHYTAAELDVWKEGSFDTATWLYHLVFSPEPTRSPSPNPRTRRLYQASVTDESHEIIGSISRSSSTTTVHDRQFSDQDEKAMIVWSRQTEPSQVVDRLLTSWTTLSPDQITLSSTRHEGDDWREGIVRMVEEAKEEDGLSFKQWEQQNQMADSEDEEFRSAEEDSISDFVLPPYTFRSNVNGDRNRCVRTSSSTDEWAKAQVYTGARVRQPKREDRSGRDTRRRGPRREQQVQFQRSTSPARSPPRPLRRRQRTEQSPSTDAIPDRAESRVHTIYSEQTDAPSRNTPHLSSLRGIDAHPTPAPVFSNPFIPNHIPPLFTPGPMPPWQESFPGYHLPTYPPEPPRPSHVSTVPQWPDPPPAAPQTPPPTKPDPTAEEQSARPNTMAKEQAVIAAIERLLERRGQEPKLQSDDPRFSRLMQLLTAQQEHDAQTEREHAKATTEDQVRQMQIARERDDEKLKHLELFIAEQRDAQRKLQAMWKEERMAMDERAKRYAQEARDLAAKEIAAAQSAKEAAQNTLNFAKAEADKRAQEEAEARVAEEKRRVEDQHKEQLQRYEELLRVFQEQHLKPQDDQRPIRRTRIAQGNRSVDVTEYSTGKRDLPQFSQSSSFDLVQEEISRLDMRLERTNDRLPSQRTRRDSFRSSAASMQSPRTSAENRHVLGVAGKSQQLIVLPTRVNRSSPKLSELRDALAGYGVDSVFEDPEDMHVGQMISYDYEGTREQIVRSTIFWEASVLSLGSELLLTMRRAGWRPAYSRISGTYCTGDQSLRIDEE
jgi:hypothetical protein